MSRMIEVYGKILELKAKRMNILFTPFSHREKNHSSELKKIRKQIAVLTREIAELKKERN